MSLKGEPHCSSPEWYAARPRGRRLRVFHALRVHNQERAASIAPLSRAELANLIFERPLQQAYALGVGLTPFGEVRMHRASFGKITGQRMPLATRTQQRQYRAPDLVQVYRARPGSLAGLFQQRKNLLVLLAAHVTRSGLLAHPDILQVLHKFVNRFSAAGRPVEATNRIAEL